MVDVAELKAQISSRWLGQDGVSAVGVEFENEQPVVVISLSGEDPDLIARLQASYANEPVRIRPNQGPIRRL
jgi:hypothetical protein